MRRIGGIILAPEGINGSICGVRKSVERVLTFIQRDVRLNGLSEVETPVSPEQEAIHHGHSSSSPLSAGEDAPFRWDHVRVKLKKEIVTLEMPSVSPIERVGTYVSPDERNELISDPETVRCLFNYLVASQSKDLDNCLYIEGVPKTESLWKGECFVFDKRVSVEHGLAQGTHKLCYGFKQPISDEASCPYCCSKKSKEEKERPRARQTQFEECGVIGCPDKVLDPPDSTRNKDLMF